MKVVHVILQGGGEHASVVLDCLLAQGADVLAVFDPKYTGELLGIQQRGVYDPQFAPNSKVIVAIGDNALRKEVVHQTSHTFTNAIHPSCILSDHIQAGTGNMILQGVIVQVNTTIGNHVILNTGASIDHDCTIGDFVHVAPRAVLCGRVTVGEGTLIGAGSIILPGITLGAWATVGAGAVVTKDIPDGAVAAGNPSRIIKIVQQL